MYLYRNNGMEMHSVDLDYVAQEGEVLSSDPLTPSEMAHAFPGRVDALRPEVWERIKAFRDDFRQKCGYQVGGKWFHSDDYSKSQQMGLVIMGAGMPAGLLWKTMDGTFVSMTPQLAQQVFGAACLSDQAIFAHAEVHRAAMMAAPDPLGYDFTTGWPQAFE